MLTTLKARFGRLNNSKKEVSLGLNIDRSTNPADSASVANLFFIFTGPVFDVIWWDN